VSDLVRETIAPAILSCVTTEVALISTPPQHVRYTIGDEVSHDISLYGDLCCEGLAYVHLGPTFFSVDVFPEIDQIKQRSGDCAPAAWAQKFTVGIVRCAPTGDLDEIVSDDEWNAAAVLNMEDAYALRRIACCARNWLVAQQGLVLDGMSFYVDQQNQVTPQGGCTERHVQLTVQFPNLECGCL